MHTNTLRNRWLVFLLFLYSLINVACGDNNDSGKIIITQAPVGETNTNMVTGEGWRYVTGSQIVLIDPDNSELSEVLTKDFNSACSPDISWDGFNMLFAGKQKENEPWQIWRMDLKSRKVTRVTQIAENCIDPVSLPTGRVIFSKTTDRIIGDHSLFASNSDGSECKQLTFHPHSNFSNSILLDGRIVTVSRQVFPEVHDPMLMVLRPDGTKAELFYMGKQGNFFTGKIRESDDGRLFFIESDSAGKGNVFSINYSRPLFTARNCSENVTGSFRSLFPVEQGKLLVSYRNSESEPFSLYHYDADTKELGDKIYTSAGMDIIDITILRENVRPKKLPSEVDYGVKTGLLLCQDINFTGLGNVGENIKSDLIEIVGIDSSLGIIKVENDGSFYLKVMADKPFQIRKLDNKGRTINQSAWIWLRPNERRGCVGCHEHPELAPENRVPLSINKNPVSVPVHISVIIEKEVELEKYEKKVYHPADHSFSGFTCGCVYLPGISPLGKGTCELYHGN